MTEILDGLIVLDENILFSGEKPDKRSILEKWFDGTSKWNFTPKTLHSDDIFLVRE